MEYPWLAAGLGQAPMDARRYALRLPPNQAIKAFLDSEQVDALREGRLAASDGVVVGVVSARPNGVVLEARRITQRFSFSAPLTARVCVELEATERGSAFSLKPIPPRFTKTVEFRGVATVAALTAMFLFQASMVTFTTILWTLAIQFLVAAIYWLVHKRSIAAVNKTLVNLVWSAWAPALEDGAPAMYRGPAALNP